MSIVCICVCALDEPLDVPPMGPRRRSLLIVDGLGRRSHPNECYANVMRMSHHPLPWKYFQRGPALRKYLQQGSFLPWKYFQRGSPALRKHFQRGALCLKIYFVSFPMNVFVFTRINNPGSVAEFLKMANKPKKERF